MELSNKEIKDILTDALLCLSIAILVALSFEQCPVLGQNTGTDSSVFLYVGNMMLNGKFPYVDAFDHKGILLYFIQYIGLKFSGGSQTGVWLIEILNFC